MFKKIFSKKENKGYISIETIIIASLIISLGSWLTFKWSLKGQEMSDKVNDNITKVEDDYKDLIDFEGEGDSSGSDNGVGDGVGDGSDLIDSDNDGLTDKEESNIGTDPNNPDTDGDGLTDKEEIDLGTDPKNPDTDGDGLTDKEEIEASPGKDFNYKEIEGALDTIMVTGYKGTDTNVQIPSIIDDKTVVGVDEYAFYPQSKYPSKGKSSVTLDSIKFPSTITTIKNNAFENNNLTSVTLPKNINDIGDNSFRNNQLTDIQFSSSLRSIGNYAFERNALTSVNLSSLTNNVVIKDYVFNNNKISSVKWYAGVETIPTGIFQDNVFTVIDETVVPFSVKKIEPAAFAAMMTYPSLTKIDLSKHTNLTHINGHADYYYTDNDAIGNGPGGAFDNQNYVKELVLPPNLQHIGKSAFSQIGVYVTNTPLKTIVIPSSVTYIGYGAFSNTFGLNNAVITSKTFNYQLKGTPSTIEDFAFRGLTKVN